MANYLSWQFSDTPASVSAFDELPLWSAPFGLLLLKHVPLRHGLTVLDIGSGAGFPLLELAQRLGPSSKCFGIDTWINANNRAREKVKTYGLKNVAVIDCSAEDLPFANDNVDLIVSSLGINNFSNPAKVFSECFRVLKPGGTIAITTNLAGHWREFYSLFEETLQQAGRPDLLPALKEHEAHRGTIASVSEMFTASGLKVTRHFDDKLEMKFLDGSSFLNHYFIKLGWLESWKNLLPPDSQPVFFDHLEQNLNNHATQNGGLTLTVPMAYIEGCKE